MPSQRERRGDEEGQDAGQDGDEQREDAIERLKERVGHVVPDRSVAGIGGSGRRRGIWGCFEKMVAKMFCIGLTP
jgi:hypothetical protein